MGRPREFDTVIALQRAMEVFWRLGYEGASLSDLTEAMGITRPSLYATYGNKEELFRQVLDRYESQYMGFIEEALAEQTARRAVDRLLRGLTQVQTCPSHPPGCLGMNGALACSREAEPVRQDLVARREYTEARLRRRLEAAKVAGDLPAGADPADLARYVMTVSQGVAVQAKAGVAGDALQRVVSIAMQGWPSA